MPLSREFKQTVMELCKSPEYRKALLMEALESYLGGDIVVGNALLRDYLNGTQAFADVANEINLLEPSLRRMLGPNGNPTVRNFFALLKVCQQREGIRATDMIHS
jgi:DNA-binding phage protein